MSKPVNATNGAGPPPDRPPVASGRAEAATLAERLGIGDPRRGFVSRVGPGPIGWEGGLVSGNGDLGALVLGGEHDETIIVGKAGLFMPVDPPRPPVDTATHLAELRGMLAAGEYQGAADFVVALGQREGYPGWLWTDPLIAAFDLRLRTVGGGATTRDYGRGVDFSTGVAAVTYADASGPLRRRLFVSRADNVVVLSISRWQDRGNTVVEPPRNVDCDLWLATRAVEETGAAERERAERARDQGIAQVNTTADPGGTLTYRCTFRRQWRGALRGYEGVARVIASGPHVSVAAQGDGVRVWRAEEILVLLRVELLEADAPSRGADMAGALGALPDSFAELLGRHTAIHGPVMSRVHLDLGGDQHDLFSEDLLAEANQPPPDHGAVGSAGGAAAAASTSAPVSAVVSPTLLEKQFQAARYVTYSASGRLFPTLQGIWNGSWVPPWSSDFTHNGNVPTALAALLSTNMPECLEPYFRYLFGQLEQYRQNARRHYGCRGIFLPSRTSSHGLDVHFNARWCMTFWTAGAGWAAHTFYDYYLHTGDRAFLRQVALPFMREAAAFYEDFMTVDGGGRYFFSPSYSPENSPPGSDAQACVNATMDMAVARQLFENLIAASLAAAAGGDGVGNASPIEDDVTRWRAIVARLPKYQVNGDGAIKEWMHPDLADNHDHRHVSHLYALFDGLPADIEARPELRAAFLRTVERRLEIRRRDGGGVMGFGLAQLGLAAASLRQPALCQEILTWLARKYWRPSLVTTHDPGLLFNVDLCGGFPALLAKMLLDSRPGHLELLPALAPAWSKGSVSGLRARGQITVEKLSWDETMIAVKLSSPASQQLSVGFPPRRSRPAHRIQITLSAGRPLELRTRLDGASEGGAAGT